MERGSDRMQQKSPLAIDTQAESLRGAYPLGQLVVADATHLRWFCNLRPTPLSDNYFVQLDYSLGGIPCLQVVAPDLFIPTGRRLPHVFPDGEMCIYDCRDGKHEWDPWIPLAVVVPWAELWLYYYEQWVVTGVWLGKEATH